MAAALIPTFVVLFSLSGSAQTLQGLPEIDTYVKLDPDVRFTFQVKETREGGDPTQAEIGPSLDFLLKPLVKLKGATEFDLNDSKSRFLVSASGIDICPRPMVRLGPTVSSRLRPSTFP